MNGLQRLELISKIGRELQSRMTYADIAAYLNGFGVNCSNSHPSTNSKWVYVKEVLSDVGLEIIVRIADELGIEHQFAVTNVSTNKNWKPNHFRLFISHLSEHKLTASNLQSALYEYGVSSFVAHEDITPTEEWQAEIESSLLSMDAIVAILTPGFHESLWTDHEIGAAIGRNLYIIPLDKGIKPYGFIAKYQAVPTRGKTVRQVAEEIFNYLITKKKSRYRMMESIADLIISSSDEITFRKYFKLFTRIISPANELLTKVSSNLSSKDFIISSNKLLQEVNQYFDSVGIEPIKIDKSDNQILDDIPF